MSDRAGQPAEVLLVEDDDGDVNLIKEAFAAGSGTKVHLTVASDGAEALELLRGRAPGPRPEIIILDLNMPKFDGRQFLREIKDDPNLRRIPVIVFTSSNADEEVIAAYSAHANCYICKPLNFQGFLATMQLIRDFWLSTVMLPVR